MEAGWHSLGAWRGCSGNFEGLCCRAAIDVENGFALAPLDRVWLPLCLPALPNPAPAPPVQITILGRSSQGRALSVSRRRRSCCARRARCAPTSGPACTAAWQPCSCLMTTAHKSQAGVRVVPMSALHKCCGRVQERVFCAVQHSTAILRAGWQYNVWAALARLRQAMPSSVAAPAVVPADLCCHV